MTAPALPLSDARVEPLRSDALAAPLGLVHATMQTLASLKITVTLFGLGIFVVLVGTLAQAHVDNLVAVRDYFHAWIMWVDVNVLFPKTFFSWMPELHITAPQWLSRATGGFVTNLNTFPAPGGLTVGTLMAVNLLAAHGWRFKVQTRGLRLVLGLVVMLVGLAVGFLTIWAGHNGGGFQAKPPFSWTTFWRFFLGNSSVLWLALVAAFGHYGVYRTIQKSAVTWFEIVGLILIGAPLALIGVLLAWGALAPVRPSDEALRIVWQLIEGGLAGLILLVGCLLIFQKRGGMVLLHAGIGLLMFNELWVAMSARERQVHLEEGQVTNFLRDIRTVELAVVDRSAEKTEDHVVVPRSRLEANNAVNQRLAKDGKPLEYIDNELLPAKLAVIAFYKNTDVEDRKAGEETPATAGRGLKEKLVERAASTGTDMGGGVDLAGAYVRFADKQTGADLGTFLLSQLAEHQLDPSRFAEKLTIGDKTYDVFLRFKREYKPYEISLIDVRKDDYLASDTPRNYSSDIRLVDPAAGVDQKIHIKMNDPLRYRNDTFYQSGYQPPLGPGSREATTLSVVLNRGWMIPYIACMLVVIGMAAHFLTTVTRFVRRREVEELDAGDVLYGQSVELETAAAKRTKRKAKRPQPVTGIGWSWFGLPLLAAGIFAMWMGSAMRLPSPKAGEMDLVRFGQLPVAHEGRVKPLDTLARNSLKALSKYETVKVDGQKRISATQWLLDTISRNPVASEHKVLRIDNPDLLKILGLEPRGGFLYSIREAFPELTQTPREGDEERPGMVAFLKQVEAASKAAKDDRTLLQQKVIELYEKLTAIMLLRESFGPPRGVEQLPGPEELQKNPKAIEEYLMARQMAERVEDELRKAKAPRPLPIAVSEARSPDDVWRLYPLAWVRDAAQQLTGKEREPAVAALEAMKTAYRRDDASTFNRELARYESYLKESSPPLWNEEKLRSEWKFNAVSPFFVGMEIYVLGFLLAIFGWLTRYRPLNWAAFTLIALTFLLHTAALWMRIDISGRPPVTNLYSSAVFIGWGAVLFGLVCEAIFRLGLGNIVAAVSGFATLLIAYLLAFEGDTITVLQAVLDTQFWLATHVVCITLGYTATYVAGLFGVLYVVLGGVTPLLDQRSRKELTRMIYGVTCFAILFSFFGTVLGGLWADDSWGRFWGWDPKENGALIIVLWNALILHARWDKLVGDRGLALLAVGGNIVTTWSWFGVNQLGKGLHSYGFTQGVAAAVVIFGLSQLLLIAAGLTPTRLWWSYKADEAGGNTPQAA